MKLQVRDLYWILTKWLPWGAARSQGASHLLITSGCGLASLGTLDKISKEALVL